VVGWFLVVLVLGCCAWVVAHGVDFTSELPQNRGDARLSYEQRRPREWLAIGYLGLKPGKDSFLKKKKGVTSSNFSNFQ